MEKLIEETYAQKVQRHAAKEARLQKQVNGNAPYRTKLIEVIIKDKLQGHEDDLHRLLKQQANYKNCEEAYERLFAMILARGSSEQKTKAELFKNKILKKSKRK